MSSFLGRTEEVAELAALLEGERMVTLTGAPGIGKTRLALELARRLGGGRAGGAHMVELAPITRPAHVARAVASALSVDEQPGQKITDAIIARVGGRRVLVVLDNCEHLLGACAKLVEGLLAACPKLRILTTSREPLGVSAETVWQVPALPVPEPEEEAPPEELTAYAAVALFVDRAGAVQPGFSLNPYLAPAVAKICRRLDGIPLAIELAAARVESLTPAEIAGRLNDRFGVLTSGRRDALPRHRTLEAALDWSHELLSEAERALLRRLSVFRGGFEDEATVAVCGGGEIEAGQVPDLLGRLVAKSLVVADSGPSTMARHRLLETVRAYTAERLEEAGEASALRAGHARFYLELAERAEPELTGPEQQRWFERLEVEHANLRSALEWCLSHGESEWGLRLGGALVLFWRVRCHFSEGRELLDAVVSAGEGAAVALRAKALWGAGFMALMRGDVDAAIPLLEECLARFRELGADQGCARALLVLGNCMQYREDQDLVLSLLAESAVLARKADDPWCLSHALGIAGFAHYNHEQLASARTLLEDSLTVAREAKDKQSLRMALLGLGLVSVRQGDYRSAQPLLEEAVELATELGEGYGRATALEYLGRLAVGRGDYGGARELLGEALALLPEVGPPGARIAPLVLLGEVARAEGDRSGARLLLDQALAQAGTVTAFPALQGLGELAAEEDDVGTARYLLEKALALARDSGGRGSTAAALFDLGELARSEGDAKRAAILHQEALELRWEIGNAAGVVASVEAVAGLAGVAGRYDDAARLLAAAKALRGQNGYARRPWESSRYEFDVAHIQRSLSAEELKAALTQGQALSLEEAVALASKRQGGRGRPSSGWWSLTASEKQVAALAAEGLTNRKIAERRCVSHWTVKTHLSRVYSKLGVTGRTELAREVTRGEERPRGPRDK